MSPITKIAFPFILYTLYFILIFLPLPASAALVQCADINNCTFCDLLQTVKNVLDLAESLAFIFVVFYVVYGGFQIMVSGVSAKWYEQGKKVITNAIIGLLIILISWVFVDQLIRTIVGASLFQGNFVSWTWNIIPCETKSVAPSTSTASPVTQNPTGSNPTGDKTALNPFPAELPEICNDNVKLAQTYGVPSTPTNSPEIQGIIDCVLGNLSDASLVDQNQIFTYENTNPKCNFTRGDTICGSCQHKQYSCHYGGVTGSAGALAVDFNATNGQEQKLFEEIKLIAGQCGFSASKVIFETSGTSAHTHVSAPSCNSSY